MSNTASNYSTKNLYCGITIAASVVLWAFGISTPALLKRGSAGLWFLLMTLAYGAMMFASSYVEEEQHIWYLVASAWLWWLGMKQCSTDTKVPKPGSRRRQSRKSPSSTLSAAIPLVTMRVIRAWNQTGQKHAGESDVARGLLQSHSYSLWCFVGIVYVVVSRKMLPKDQGPIARWASSTFAVLLCMLGLAFKVASTMADAPELLHGLLIAQNGILTSLNLTTQARAVFSGIIIFCLGLYSFGTRRSSPTRSGGDHATQGKQSQKTRNETATAHLESLHGVLTLFLVTQSRVTNIPLFGLFDLQMRILASMDLSSTEVSLTSIILQHASFFAFGGSNAISSVDLSNGYNGVSGYNAVTVGILTFCSNWAGPIWWTCATMILLVRCQEDWYGSLNEFRQLSTCFIASSVVSVMLACTVLRTHLFIWSVFSPKYLYVVAWSLGQHLCVSMSSANILIWLDSR